MNIENEKTNWAKNHTYNASSIESPQTIDDLQDLTNHLSSMKTLGTRHSFNKIADTTGTQISTRHLDKVLDLDIKNGVVKVEAGIRYGELSQFLHRAGYSLHNLASLPHISVGGACATATHGSGDANGNLSTAVSAIKIVTSAGTVVSLSRKDDGDKFLGAVVGLGALGVVAELSLDIAPTFDICQEVYQKFPLSNAIDKFDEVMSNAYSVSIFTNWEDPEFNQLWFKHRMDEIPSLKLPPQLLGATRASSNQHPIYTLSAENCTEQMGIPGHWFERLPHFRLNHTPSAGDELQSEYFVPRQSAKTALKKVESLASLLTPLLQISEIRTVAADDLWMSPCYKEHCVGIHFTWKNDLNAVRQILPIIESALAEFNAKPHWAKLFTMESCHLRSLYPRLPDFIDLMREFDQRGKFHNQFLETYIYGR